MAKDDPTPHALVGRAGLVFAYVSFGFAVVMFAGALYFLPLSSAAKLFLGGGAALLTSMFAFLAYATHLMMRPRGGPAAGAESTDHKKPTDHKKRTDHKEGEAAAPADTEGSHRPR